MSDEIQRVMLKIQDGVRELDVPFDIPAGIDPRIAVGAVHRTIEELHDMEPLIDMRLKVQTAIGLFGDHHPISKIRDMISRAPLGTWWGIQIIEPERVLANPVYRKTDSPVIKARCRMSECQNLNEVISTATCFALLTSASARGQLALHGFRPRILPPEGVPVEAPKSPSGIHERKLKLVTPLMTESNEAAHPPAPRTMATPNASVGESEKKDPA